MGEDYQFPKLPSEPQTCTMMCMNPIPSSTLRIKIKVKKKVLQSVCRVCTEPWVESPAFHNPGMVVHTRNFSTWEEESGRAGHLWLQSKFKVSLGYVRHCLKQTTSKKKKTTQTTGKEDIGLSSPLRVEAPVLSTYILSAPVHHIGLFQTPLFSQRALRKGAKEKNHLGLPEPSPKDPA